MWTLCLRACLRLIREGKATAAPGSARCLQTGLLKSRWSSFSKAGLGSMKQKHQGTHHIVGLIKDHDRPLQVNVVCPATLQDRRDRAC
jgi:hypothetical protein